MYDQDLETRKQTSKGGGVHSDSRPTVVVGLHMHDQRNEKGYFEAKCDFRESRVGIRICLFSRCVKGSFFKC